MLKERGSRYGVFGVTGSNAAPASPSLAALDAIEKLRVPREAKTLGDHFSDLPRKACLQCHVWSAGVAVQGRLGQDGLYRGAGCAACHVTYAEDGRAAARTRASTRASPGIRSSTA